ncbi:MAG: hypothetical protein WCE45_03110, partial [Sedimentisphaerales bacterium]
QKPVKTPSFFEKIPKKPYLFSKFPKNSPSWLAPGPLPAAGGAAPQLLTFHFLAASTSFASCLFTSYILIGV